LKVNTLLMLNPMRSWLENALDRSVRHDENTRYILTVCSKFTYKSAKIQLKL